jgi:hypothetical protein
MLRGDQDGLRSEDSSRYAGHVSWQALEREVPISLNGMFPAAIAETPQPRQRYFVISAGKRKKKIIAAGD